MITAPSQLRCSDVLPCLRGAGIILAHGGLWDSQNVVEVLTKADNVGPEAIFIAYKGVSFDGHTKIGEAVKRGVAGIILEDPAFIPLCESIPWVHVISSRESWPWLVAARWGNPEKKLQLTGVTGTNGKTSTVWIFKELLQAAGHNCLSIGTIGAYLGNDQLPTQHTTPDPDALFALFAEAVRRQVRFVAMEVSSHALVQHKLGPVRFDTAAWTSFSRDHLDFHSNMKEYFAAKWRLFGEYLRGPSSLSCFCEDVADVIHQPAPVGETYWYGKPAQDPSKRYQIRILEETYGGSRLSVTSPDGLIREGFIPFFGEYAVKNFTAALMMADRVLGRPLLANLWSQIRPVRGRLEPVWSALPDRPMVFVDYAHTPDALDKALSLLKSHGSGKLWVLFGCGGDRDPGKRPLMAEIAERLADYVVVTSDNPRTEDPNVIIEQIMGGFRSPQKVKSLVDRATAIQWIVRQASPQDVVLIAGKGHEDYQIIGKQKITFDDRLIAQKAFVKK